MRFVNVLTAVAFAVSASGASIGASFAQGADCSCVTAGSGAGDVGSIVSAKGDVLATGANNFDAAAAGTSLSVGSEISVGANSSARISVGSCALNLGANTVTRISQLEGGNLCVAQASAGALPVAPGGALAGMPALAPLGLFGAVAAGAAVLGATKNSKGGEDPISQ